MTGAALLQRTLPADLRPTSKTDMIFVCYLLERNRDWFKADGKPSTRGGSFMPHQEDRFGINLTQYVKDHESLLRERLARPGAQAQPVADAELLACHLQKIAWLQHERLIHLLVTMLFACLMLFLYGLVLFLDGNWLVLILLVIVIAMLGAYVRHYFFLENTVQRWYKYADRLYWFIHENNRP
jgi:hypothetical protein